MLCKAPLLPALGLAWMLAACAHGPADDLGSGGGGRGHRHGGDGPEGAHAARLPNLFISPSGQPFHAAAGAPYPVAAWFAAADADHDGRLTRAEFRADAAAFFRQLDANHDGLITGVEVQAYEQAIAPEILPRITDLHAGEGMDQELDLGDSRNAERPRPVGHGHRMAEAQPARPANIVGTQGAGVYSLLNEPEPVAAADTAFDGRITLAEFLATADRRFDRLDASHQGYLTLADLPKTPVQEAIARAARQKPAPKAAAAP